MEAMRTAAVRIFQLVALFSGLSVAAWADTVTPVDHASSGVHVRQRPSAKSKSIDVIQPSDRAERTDSKAGWHRVKLLSGRAGYVSQSWVTVHPSLTETLTGDYSIHAADVGTGLAIAVKGPDFFLIFDGGSNDDTARGDKNRFLAYLRATFPSLAVIDHLLLSHPHRDHVELLPDVLAAYDVKHVWDSGAVNDICGYRAFVTAISKEPGVSYRSARNDAGTVEVPFKKATCYGKKLTKEQVRLTHGQKLAHERVTLGNGAAMTILHADGSDHPGDFNENSLVVLLELGDKRVLLMGDAEAGGRAPPSTAPTADSIEGKLLACCRDELHADVMVVGHHGSKTSSRKVFLDAVGAKTFVVSSGPTKYATVTLPDKVVIDELKARGTVFRTDLDDTACKTKKAKIGPDADRQPGGCDNVRIFIKNGAGGIVADYWRGKD